MTKNPKISNMKQLRIPKMLTMETQVLFWTRYKFTKRKSVPWWSKVKNTYQMNHIIWGHIRVQFAEKKEWRQILKGTLKFIMWKELRLIALSVTRVWNLVQGCLSTRVPPILVYWSERTRSSRINVAPMFNHSFWINRSSRSSIKNLIGKKWNRKQNSQQSLGQVEVGRPYLLKLKQRALHIASALFWKILHSTEYL